jgi:hypothetical protein
MDQNQNIVLVQPGSKKHLTDELQAWMSHFSNHFNLVFNRVLGSGYKIIPITEENTKDINIIREDCMVIFLMHEKFLQDKGYREFLNKTAGLIGSPDVNTIESCLNSMKINLSGYDYNQLPDQVKFCMGYDMYLEGEPQGTTQLVSPEDKDYWPVLLDLVMDIKHIRSTVTSAMKQVSIYLATCTADQKKQWYQLRRELMGYGYKIYPDIDLHNPPDELKSYVQRCVDKSYLSIHILGNKYGKTYADTGKNLTELQFQFVTEYINTIHNDPDLDSHSNLQRLIWIPPETTDRDEKQEELIQQLKRDIEKLHRTEIIQAPIELLKTLVLNKIQESESRKSESLKVKKDGKKVIYLIHDKSGESSIEDLEKVIQAGGLETTKIPYGSDQESLLGLHKTCLKECDGALIRYSGISRAWLMSKVKDLQKAPGLGRSTPMLLQGVVIQGKDTAENVAFPSNMLVIRDKELKKQLDPMLKKLKESK